jgi:hypothetical protein
MGCVTRIILNQSCEGVNCAIGGFDNSTGFSTQRLPWADQPKGVDWVRARRAYLPDRLRGRVGSAEPHILDPTALHEACRALRRRASAGKQVGMKPPTYVRPHPRRGCAISLAWEASLLPSAGNLLKIIRRPNPSHLNRKFLFRKGKTS